MNAEIRQIADTYLSKVRETGSSNVMAICPFHARPDGTPEKSASFAMSLETGLYFCHSCQSKGNLRTFLKAMGVSAVLVETMYKYALEHIDGQATPPPNPLQPKIISLSPIPDQLLGLFNYCPTSLLQSGFLESTLSDFEIGYDKWHARVTYPMRDLLGQLVAVNGRAIQEDQWPRHKIYDVEYPIWGLPERKAWDKRTVLYNAHRIYPEVYFQTTPDFVVVVEGYKACMWVHQAGIPHVVALLGTYLSWEQKWVLERMGAPVYLFLDNNAPGWRGAYKAASILSETLQVRIVPYPERLAEDIAAQPDSCSPEEILFQCHHAIPWHAFLNGHRATTTQPSS